MSKKVEHKTSRHLNYPRKTQFFSDDSKPSIGFRPTKSNKNSFFYHLLKVMDERYGFMNKPAGSHNKHQSRQKHQTSCQTRVGSSHNASYRKTNKPTQSSTQNDKPQLLTDDFILYKDQKDAMLNSILLPSTKNNINSCEKQRQIETLTFVTLNEQIGKWAINEEKNMSSLFPQ